MWVDKCPCLSPKETSSMNHEWCHCMWSNAYTWMIELSFQRQILELAKLEYFDQLGEHAECHRRSNWTGFLFWNLLFISHLLCPQVCIYSQSLEMFYPLHYRVNSFKRYLLTSVRSFVFKQEWWMSVNTWAYWLILYSSEIFHCGFQIVVSSNSSSLWKADLQTLYCSSYSWHAKMQWSQVTRWPRVATHLFQLCSMYNTYVDLYIAYLVVPPFSSESE